MSSMAKKLVIVDVKVLGTQTYVSRSIPKKQLWGLRRSIHRANKSTGDVRSRAALWYAIKCSRLTARPWSIDAHVNSMLSASLTSSARRDINVISSKPSKKNENTFAVHPEGHTSRPGPSQSLICVKPVWPMCHTARPQNTTAISRDGTQEEQTQEIWTTEEYLPEEMSSSVGPQRGNMLLM